MEAIVLKQSGLSWRLATLEQYGAMPIWIKREGTDICSYRGYVIKGIMWALIYTVLLSVFVGVPVGEGLGWAAAMFHEGKWIKPVDGPFMYMIVGLSSALLLIVLGFSAYGISYLYQRLRGTQAEPSAATRMYRSWREKACYRVVFK